MVVQTNATTVIFDGDFSEIFIDLLSSAVQRRIYAVDRFSN